MVRVLLDHPRFLVINKPPGVGMHQEGQVPGILTLVKSELGLPELYPVHRLDKVTSGVLLLAKDEDANRQLSAAFRERRVEKYYLALADRKPAKKQGLIVGDMARSRRATWKLLHTRARPAVTQFFSGSIAESGEPALRWFLLKPTTGRTHQIRVAMKSLGTPVWGDPLYGGLASSPVRRPIISQPERTYLHAWGLRFPWEDGLIEVMAPPADGAAFSLQPLQAQLQQLAPPWNQPWPALAPALLKLVGRASPEDRDEDLSQDSDCESTGSAGTD